MSEYEIPVGAVGPGTQPVEQDGAELDVMSMPDEMSTFSMPDLPEPERVANLTEGLDKIKAVLALMEAYQVSNGSKQVDISSLDNANRDLIDQVLGEGEVSIVFDNDQKITIQESVLAGVWRIQWKNSQDKVERDVIEIAPIPELVHTATFAQAQPKADWDGESTPAGVLNAPPLIAEIDGKVAEYQPGDKPHAINLTLLPQTEEDLAFLDNCLGKGPVVILSRGYGNCRITSTGTKHVWWVQYYNTQDAIILNSLEITDVPSVACASQEDLDDSRERLADILEAYA